MEGLVPLRAVMGEYDVATKIQKNGETRARAGLQKLSILNLGLMTCVDVSMIETLGFAECLLDMKL
jgi:hypothetical protein